MAKMTGARFVAETLAGYGVSHVFLVPSILVHTLYEMERRTQIKRVVTHGEKSAVYMADGYARASGRPGICMAQTVGTANLAAGLRDPYLACVPVMAFTGGPYSHTRSRMTYQQVDDFPLFKPLTKFSAQANEIHRLPDLIRQAFRSSTTGKPGPVHIEFEGHQGEILETQEADLEVIVEEKFSRVPAFRPEPGVEAVKEVAALLTASKKPIIVAGGGVRSSGAARELIELAEKLTIPVATSLNAKDVIPGDHPLSVGVVGLYSRKSANRAVLESDLVFFVGSQTGSQVTFEWQVPPLGTPVVQLDIEPQELGRHYVNKASLQGDAKVALGKLIEAVGVAGRPSPDAWAKRALSLVQEWREEFSELMSSDDEPMRPERLCGELSDLLPADTLLVSDTGHSGMWTGGMIDLKRPGQGFIRAAGSLGWGLPASLGARCALPDRPILLFTGDGGLWYHLSELETALRWGLNVTILVNDNHSLNQGIWPNTNAYGGRLSGKHGELWEFRDIDLAEVARTIGVNGIRVKKPSELSVALEKAFSSDTLTVIDVVTDIRALAPLAFKGDT